MTRQLEFHKFHRIKSQDRGQKDEWMARWMDGWLDGWIVGQGE